MAVTTTNLGVITAYGDAVAAGYTGTKAEWQALMASYATVGQQAVDAKNDAVAAKNTAVSKATEATTAASTATTKANEASASAQSIAQSAAQIQENTDSIDQLMSDLTQKANVDGYYADLVSGGATQILSDMVATDAVPYNYRTAGGSLEIGDRMKLKEIVGGSLAVNQLVQNGNFVDTTAWTVQHASFAVSGGVATLTPSNDGSSALITQSMSIKDHVYFAAFSVNTPSSTGVVNFEMRDASGVRILCASSQTGQWERCKSVYKIASSNDSGYFRIKTNAVQTDGQAFTVKDVILHDLTAMFGTTIADYVYGLETATAGAGVAWLKAHFPRIFDAGYVPYNAGSFEHVTGLSAHKMTGFNQWDEEWEQGGLVDGNPSTDASRVRSKNYCECVANTAYYRHCGNGAGINIFWYDADKNYISYEAGTSTAVVTSPANARYFKICTTTAYGGTYLNDICINLHWDGERDGEYEPYEEHSYPLDSDVTLRGIYKLDANNSLYADGDEYEADGTVTRQYREVVFNGTENWGIESSSWNSHGLNAFYIVLGAGNQAYFPSASDMPMLICDKFVGASNTSLKTSDKTGLIGFVGGSGSANYIEILSDATDVASFKTWLANNNTKVVYKLITPTTETADPYTEIQNVSNWGTEEFVTTSLVPVGHVTEYQHDLRAKIEVAPESPDTDGLYLMKRENGQNSYVAYLGELPSDPTTDGTYTLKCTVASGTATKTWEADT